MINKWTLIWDLRWRQPNRTFELTGQRSSDRSRLVIWRRIELKSRDLTKSSGASEPDKHYKMRFHTANQGAFLRASDRKDISLRQQSETRHAWMTKGPMINSPVHMPFDQFTSGGSHCQQDWEQSRSLKNLMYTPLLKWHVFAKNNRLW